MLLQILLLRNFFLALLKSRRQKFPRSCSDFKLTLLQILLLLFFFFFFFGSFKEADEKIFKKASLIQCSRFCKFYYYFCLAHSKSRRQKFQKKKKKKKTHWFNAHIFADSTTSGFGSFLKADDKEFPNSSSDSTLAFLQILLLRVLALS